MKNNSLVDINAFLKSGRKDVWFVMIEKWPNYRQFVICNTIERLVAVKVRNDQNLASDLLMAMKAYGWPTLIINLNAGTLPETEFNEAIEVFSIDRFSLPAQEGKTLEEIFPELWEKINLN